MTHLSNITEAVGRTYNHVMEQLEIDWNYADVIQAADNGSPIVGREQGAVVGEPPDAGDGVRRRPGGQVDPAVGAHDVDAHGIYKKRNPYKAAPKRNHRCQT